eukprot:scaffold218869_cov36-Tisochrysis_lutea.AAC.3
MLPAPSPVYRNIDSMGVSPIGEPFLERPQTSGCPSFSLSFSSGVPSGIARRLTQSHGNYDMWAKRRAQQQKTFERAAALRAEEVKKLKEYAGHGFKYGGASSQINKMKMKEKQVGVSPLLSEAAHAIGYLKQFAEKLEQTQAEMNEEAAALMEDMELPLTLKAGGELSGYLVQVR